ncbi:CPBP family intramembrane glutamic endopeptidase [uncultured Methanobrevibacter sp.]|uniref:CPBP family intramembrane glutamic endopeptidase n=1 Tax=uncultured Methanobrevibacter sp. TaxID=253161 RepID=UPI0025EC722F|nr:CPBP family intramembrane glutamic endopeptidase [uncultured Methanobrevibacter sp.]
MIILQGIILIASSAIYGGNALSLVSGGYEALNSELGEIITDLGIIMIIPSLYIATKIVGDRPFSSYSSSRGGWNFKLFLKALIIPLIALLIYNAVESAIKGPEGTYHFSILFLIVSIILVPLQCIAEEYVYRGLIMQTFGSWFKIPVVAILLQAILFSVSHGYNSLGLVEIFVSGIVFGFLTWKTNGIEVSSAMHTANNFAISLFVMFGLKSTTSTPLFNDVVMSIIFDIILCAIMYYVGMKTNWFGEIKENPENT